MDKTFKTKGIEYCIAHNPSNNSPMVVRLRKKYDDVEMILFKDSDDKYELMEDYGR